MSARLSAAITLVPLTIALISVACSSDDRRSGGGTGVCQRSSDCSDPDARCVAGACVTECGDARDCQPEEACVNGLCTTASPCRQDDECQYDHECVQGMCAPIEGYCEENRDCNFGSTCDLATSRCVRQDVCTSDADCFAGELCDNGACVARQPECVRNSDCPQTQACDAGVCVAVDIGCTNDAECGPREICAAGQCEPECVEDRDCEAGWTCTSGACMPECVQTSECGGGEICVSGRCEPECSEDRDCPADHACVSGSCEPTSTNNPTSCTADPSVCTAAQECCEGACVQRGLCPAAGDYWDQCTAASQCSTELCVGGTDGNGHCTERCGSRQECQQSPVTSLCIQSYHLIAQQAGGNTLIGLCYHDDTGTACNPMTTNACFDGVCVDKRVGGTPQGLCSIRCRSGADCLPGWACGIKDFNIGGVPTTLDVCVPIGESCFGEGTAAADQCYSGICLTDDQTMQGFCTSVCDTAQRCPAGWGCVDVGGTGVCMQ